MNFVPHQIQVTTGSLVLYLGLFHPPLPPVPSHHLCLSSSPFLSRHRCWRGRLHTLRLTFHGSTLPWIILAGVCFAFLDDLHRSNNEDLVALGYLHTEVHHSIDLRAKKHPWWEPGYLLSSLKSTGYGGKRVFNEKSIWNAIFELSNSG